MRYTFWPVCADTICAQAIMYDCAAEVQADLPRTLSDVLRFIRSAPSASSALGSSCIPRDALAAAQREPEVSKRQRKTSVELALLTRVCVPKSAAP